jgi:hypothetical protein
VQVQEVLVPLPRQGVLLVLVPLQLVVLEELVVQLH